MKDEQLKQKRDKAFLDAMGYLNDRDALHGRHLFDCGELGFMLVEWRRFGWEARWFDSAIGFGAETSVLEDEVADCLSFTGERRKHDEENQ